MQRYIQREREVILLRHITREINREEENEGEETGGEYKGRDHRESKRRLGKDAFVLSILRGGSFMKTRSKHVH